MNFFRGAIVKVLTFYYLPLNVCNRQDIKNFTTTLEYILHQIKVAGNAKDQKNFLLIESKFAESIENENIRRQKNTREV